jgi:hypothetical protein
MGLPIQKPPPECAEVIPSLPGEYDGRPKWAEVDVIGGSNGADSVTTPSWDDEAQAESSHAITKASVPNHGARLFTKPNVLITGPNATSGTRGLCQEKGATKKFCVEREARV